MFDLARELGGMTVGELEERIRMDEVVEWAVLAALEDEEREERRKQAELKSRVQQGLTSARAKLRGKAA